MTKIERLQKLAHKAVVNPAALTPHDKVCVNCAHHVHDLSLSSILAAVFERTTDGTHRCSFNGISETLHPVTGKITVHIQTRTCLSQRNDSYSDDCRSDGQYWTPNEKWKKNKKNIFKILVDTGE